MSACKKDNSTEHDLMNKLWVLGYIQNTQIDETINYPGSIEKITLVFTDSLNVIEFRGICNDGTGTYSYSSDSEELSVHGLKTTLIACTDFEWEGYTIRNLNDAYRFKINGNSLAIFSKGDYNLYFSLSP